MSTKASAAAIAQATRDLTVVWEETKAHWHDAKSLEFEQQYLADLPNLVTRALSAMGEIDTLFRKIHNDCE